LQIYATAVKTVQQGYQKLKAGDLVKRKGNDWIALVIEMKESNGYSYPQFMIVDSGEIQSCSRTLLEVISEA